MKRTLPHSGGFAEAKRYRKIHFFTIPIYIGTLFNCIFSYAMPNTLEFVFTV